MSPPATSTAEMVRGSWTCLRASTPSCTSPCGSELGRQVVGVHQRAPDSIGEVRGRDHLGTWKAAHDLALDLAHGVGGIGTGAHHLVLVTHDEWIAERADRVLRLADGRLVGDTA